MADRIRHRGPDGHGVKIIETRHSVIGLGHRRLAIIDLSDAARQPFVSRCGRFSIVFNGEIYNYLELKKVLEGDGIAFETKSDTEVLLACYLRWGSDCLQKLNGMFAFAIWDGVKEQLFVARDRFGEKPLFYSLLRGGGIALASEMKSLFALPQISIEENVKTAKSFLNSSYFEDEDETFFSEIRRFKPAHAVIVSRTGKVERTWRFWTPDYGVVRNDLSEREIIDTFLQKLRQSVQLRLRSDVPVGTSLSGGLDSSMIVCLLAKEKLESGNLTQNVFSARFDSDPVISEGPQIDEVVRHTGVNAFAVEPTPADLEADCRDLHWHQEEPFPSASIFLQWKVMKLARQQNTTVLLDGQGADEILAGYAPYFQTFQLDLLERNNLWTLIRETRAFGARLTRASRTNNLHSRRFAAKVALSATTLLRHFIRRPRPDPSLSREGVPDGKRGYRLRNQLAMALQYNTLPALLRYADRNSMAFSREVRLPYLDHEFVEFCISIPDTFWIRNGWQKYVLRKAGDSILPSAIQWRVDKVGFAAPLDLWLRQDLKDWAWDRLNGVDFGEFSDLARREIDGLWRRHQGGTENLSWQLWRWISYGVWRSLLKSGSWRKGL